MAQNNTGRFQVGQRIVVMQYKIKIGNEKLKQLFRPVSYIPWETWQGTMELIGNGVEFKVLTVTEEFDVHWDQDQKEEKKYKGYLLKDDDGNVWCNQYPYASYGQLSTEPDYYFQRYYPEGTDYKKLSDSELSVWKMADNWIDDIDHFVNNVLTVGQDDHAMMKTHLTWLIKKLEKSFRVSVKKEPIWEDDQKFTKTVIKWL